LSLPQVKRCVTNVNVAFSLLRENAYAGNLDFYNALRRQETYIAMVPGDVASHAGVTPPAILSLANAAAYRRMVLQSSTTDVEFNAFTRASLIARLTKLNSQIDLIDQTIIESNYDQTAIIGSFLKHGLYFAGIVRKLLYYYAERIETMRKAVGRKLSHREIQAVFECGGTLIKDFPVRPTNYDLQAGGMTLSMTLSADKFNPMNDKIVKSLVENIVSKFLPAKGFQKKIRPKFNSSEGTNLITLSEDRSTMIVALPKMGPDDYSISSAETVVISIPESLTEKGSTYPFFAQFVVRPDPRGLLWNTVRVFGDMYSRPTQTDMQTSPNLTAHMAIAGDTFLPLTEVRRLEIINGFVPSGWGDPPPVEYSWSTVVKRKLVEDPDSIYLDKGNTRVNLRLPPIPGYSIPAAETISVTIPGSVTVRGFDHPLGEFVVRATIGGSLKGGMTGIAAASGSFTISLKIMDDVLKPKSYETVMAIANAIHSPHDPLVPGGFMESLMPVMKDPVKWFDLWEYSPDSQEITMFLPFHEGYAVATIDEVNPMPPETISFSIPPEASARGRRHYFEPIRIQPGAGIRGGSPPWPGELKPTFLPEFDQYKT